MVRKDLWTREQLLLALNLYHKIPFGQYDRRNTKVIELAGLIGRTPSAVSRKLGNFASFDPYHQNRGVTGLSNAGKTTEAIWKEFYDNWDQLVLESETVLENLTQSGVTDEVEKAVSAEKVSEPPMRKPKGPTETERSTKVRLGQRFFRLSIMANYRELCCVCGIPIPELLIASHIIPWKDREDLRLNPSNGLCLCALHDKAFDRGFLTIDVDYIITISSMIDRYLPQEGLNNSLVAYQDHKISLPDRFLPDKDFLKIHRQKYFLE